MLHTTARAREKILLAGPYGSGKSLARNRLIHMLNQTGSDARVYVIDTDDTMDRAADAYGEEFLTRVEWRYVAGYEDWLDAAQTFAPKITADDWLVVDRIDRLWTATQDYYVEKRFGQDAANFYLQYAIDPVLSAAGNPLHALAGDHGTNWDIINRHYAKVIANLVFPPSTQTQTGHRGHVLACADVKKLGEKEDESLIRTFARFGVRPEGQKHLASQFHTVLLMYPGPPKWQVTTAREREGREYLEGKQVQDFVLDYLLDVGGWSLD